MHNFFSNHINKQIYTDQKNCFRFVKSDIDPTTLRGAHQNLGILENLTKEQIKDNVQLSIWEEMEIRETKLSMFNTPQNVFQELIQWTEQEKLWQFPINNEQGITEQRTRYINRCYIYIYINYNIHIFIYL